MYKQMITLAGQNDNNAEKASGFFLDKNAAGFYEWHDWSAEKGLERLVFRVARTPKYLQGHLERIYYCFQQQLNEQLFGALIDLLVVLNREGSDLCWRMMTGSKSKLKDEQFEALTQFMENNQLIPVLFLSNRYSVFTKGIFSMNPLLKMADQKGDKEIDPLKIARDFIETSQLDDAMAILEQAIMEQPERQELHAELLPLYRITSNKTRFHKIYEELSSRKLLLPPEWEQQNSVFSLKQ